MNRYRNRKRNNGGNDAKPFERSVKNGIESNYAESKVG